MNKELAESCPINLPLGPLERHSPPLLRVGGGGLQQTLAANNSYSSSARPPTKFELIPRIKTWSLPRLCCPPDFWAAEHSESYTLRGRLCWAVEFQGPLHRESLALVPSPVSHSLVVGVLGEQFGDKTSGRNIGRVDKVTGRFTACDWKNKRIRGQLGTNFRS